MVAGADVLFLFPAFPICRLPLPAATLVEAGPHQRKHSRGTGRCPGLNVEAASRRRAWVRRVTRPPFHQELLSRRNKRRGCGVDLRSPTDGW